MKMRKKYVGLLLLGLLLLVIILSSFVFVVFGDSTQFGQSVKGGAAAWQPTGVMVGSRFTSPSSGTANSISVYIYNPTSTATNVKCAIYGESDKILIATTQQNNVPSGFNGWQTFNFATAPSLTNGASYSLVVWLSNKGCNLYYNSGSTGQTWYTIQTYGNFPNGPYNSLTGYTQENNVYSIYCTLNSSPSPTPPTTNFNMRGATVMVSNFFSGNPSYQPNAWQLLKSGNINTVCIGGGTEGDVAHFNMINYPNAWAQNLNNFLSIADQNGIKVYFGILGTNQGTLFGIVSPDGTNSYTSLTQAKIMIDQLAGNNALGHNFITDSRVVGWRTSNEVDISNSAVLSWNTQLCDYIRSKGGNAWISSPWNGNSYDFTTTIPLVQGHVTYYESHVYLVKTFYNNGNIMSYSTFYNVYKNCLNSVVVQPALNNGIPLSQVILGEFGIWNGIGSDVGLTSVSFTDAQRAVYIQAVYDAARDVGIKNIALFEYFAIKQSNGGILAPNYGIVDGNGNFYGTLGSIIQNAYSPG